MMLCDAAQAVEGKLYILGGGWSVVGPAAMPMAIAIKLEIPWDQANRPCSWRLSLVDADGHAVFLPTPDGSQQVMLEGQFEVGRPAGLPPGTPLDLPMVINIAPLPLRPGTRFEWLLDIDGNHLEDWRAGFSTRAAPPTEGI